MSFNWCFLFLHLRAEVKAAWLLSLCSHRTKWALYATAKEKKEKKKERQKVLTMITSLTKGWVGLAVAPQTSPDWYIWQWLSKKLLPMSYWLAAEGLIMGWGKAWWIKAKGTSQTLQASWAGRLNHLTLQRAGLADSISCLKKTKWCDSRPEKDYL